MLKCSSCGAENPDESRFCTECGAAMAAAQAGEAKCAGCGATLAAGAKFCVACGHPVDGAAGPAQCPACGA
ncbi:MAG: zinc-ribbon domain-containing protein, partial [Thiobacillus sp.]|nr:zinc-ribbon domain-containing protein [Thiobacillus sp.]